MKRLLKYLQPIKAFFIRIVIVRFFKPLLKDIPQKCPKCGGKVKLHGIDFIGRIEYNVYRCVDCKTEYV